MIVKVASLNPNVDKEKRNGVLEKWYAPPGSDLATICKHTQLILDRCDPMLDKAAAEGAKIVCLPEALHGFPRKGGPATREQRIEMIARGWQIFHDSLARAAQRTGLYIVAGCPRYDGKHTYNSAHLFSDKGEIMGIYDKVQLARGEAKNHRRGQSFPVFPTPFGKVGMFVCWDILFPEPTQCLMMNGAEILFQPTYGHAGFQADFQAQCRAHDACLPIVISMWGGNGRIIDRDGRILAAGATTADWRGVAPDQNLYAEIDIHAKRKFLVYEDFQAGLIAERQPEAYEPLMRIPEARYMPVTDQ